MKQSGCRQMGATCAGSGLVGHGHHRRLDPLPPLLPSTGKRRLPTGLTGLPPLPPRCCPPAVPPLSHPISCSPADAATPTLMAAAAPPAANRWLNVSSRRSTSWRSRWYRCSAVDSCCCSSDTWRSRVAMAARSARRGSLCIREGSWYGREEMDDGDFARWTATVMCSVASRPSSQVLCPLVCF